MTHTRMPDIRETARVSISPRANEAERNLLEEIQRSVATEPNEAEEQMPDVFQWSALSHERTRSA